MTSNRPTKANWQPPLSEDNYARIEKGLSYEDIMGMLNDALTMNDSYYADLTELHDELQTQYRDSFHECNTKERGTVEIVLTRLRGENRVFNAYNEHRLGRLDLQTAGPSIVENVHPFPFRSQVVLIGYFDLTEGLPSIYSGEPKLPSPRAQFPTADSNDSKLPNPRAGFPTADSNDPELPNPRAEFSTADSNDSTKPKPKTGRATANYDKLEDAPPANLDFPAGNITLAEMTAFHPGGLKSWDSIDRFCGNGATQAVLSTMINHFRVMPKGPIPSNSVYRMLKGPIAKRAKVQPEYKDWTTGIHLEQFHDTALFDPTSVSVTGFRAPMDGKKQNLANPIPIKDLTIGVKVFPTGDDALDLTRAVQYCVANPEENLLYPTDFEELVSQLPQTDPRFAQHPPGPAPVQPGHQDAAIIARYLTTQKAAEVRNAIGRKRDSRGRLTKVESEYDEMDDGVTESDDDDLDDDGSGMRPGKNLNKLSKLAPRGHRKFSSVPATLRSRKGLLAEEFDSDSDGDEFQGPKKKKKADSQARRSSRATKVTKGYQLDMDAMDEDEEEEYRPVLEKPRLLAMYAMDKDMIDADDESDED